MFPYPGLINSQCDVSKLLPFIKAYIITVYNTKMSEFICFSKWHNIRQYFLSSPGKKTCGIPRVTYSQTMKKSMASYVYLGLYLPAASPHFAAKNFLSVVAFSFWRFRNILTYSSCKRNCVLSLDLILPRFKSDHIIIEMIDATVEND